MSNTPATAASAAWPLSAQTAAELMTPNPVSLRDTATVAEAVAFLTDSGYSAAPVIDATGRPAGVVSRTDIVVYDRARMAVTTSAAAAPAGVGVPRDGTRVRDLMTPAVFAVAPHTPAADVVRQMVQLNVHRLYVVDHDGVLVGVISALDLLGRLCLSGGPDHDAPGGSANRA